MDHDATPGEGFGFEWPLLSIRKQVSSLQPSWCLAVNTMYFMPACFASATRERLASLIDHAPPYLARPL